MRLPIYLLILTIFIASCSFNGQEVQFEDSYQTNFDTQTKDTFSLYMDTLHQVKLKSLGLDSFQAYYVYDINHESGIIYHETGKINTARNRYGISLYSINDTTLKIDLLKDSTSTWVKCDSLNISKVGFSPAMFFPDYGDFNQDGVNDVLLVFWQTMSVAYNHGHLLIFSESKEEFILIRNSSPIPNLCTENGKILSHTRNHPGHEPRKYRKTDEYIIQGDSLVLIHSNKVFEE